ncbi:MAG: MtrB/PioB family decaheme-associated outer membrane protein [Gammaproteobacteria bacterium]|nr:MtrB/PioB family decaheme-associated outer membrane protein [Gammaproteobacteria bacterium]MCW9056798.1 MtrB/PioB family decaheme-associated outer membrane protein [Gammaproteobacteria bacterium]
MNRNKIITGGALTKSVLLAMLFSGAAIAETTDAENTLTEPTATDTSVTETPVIETPTTETDITVDLPTASDFMVDTANWKCKDCAFEEGYSGEVELGIGSVSDDSFKFGEYNGLYEKSGFIITNARVRYRDLEANYFDLSVNDLGLDSRSLNIEGGHQGKYKVFFSYDEIAHAFSDSIMTPYSGNGSANLSLPVGWVPAGTTTSMSSLAASLQKNEVKLQRTRMDLGISFLPTSSWKYDINYRHETREGTKRSAGSFFFNAAQMIEPVDYVTDEIDASASYIGKRWQATLAYYGSFFSNENKSLTWDEAFNPIIAGATSGQRALAPDNLFHQLIMSAGYQISSKTRLSGDISIGRMQQDEDFLPATTNSSLTVAALPRNSADAEVDTLQGNIRFITSINDKIRLNASYNYSDHDNQTPQSLYTWVSTDDFVNTPETNQPYSFTRQETRLGGDYRFDRSIKISAGVDHDRFERTLQEVDKTTEVTGWGKLIIRGKDFMDMTFKLAQAKRDVSNYQVAAEIDPPQNPLLRKYNMADRSRTTAGATVNAMLSETLNAGLSIDYAKDDYSESTLGLVDANELNFNADASAILTEESSMHVFAGQERIESSQAGSSSFSTPTWFANNDDTINSIGMGYKQQLMEDKLELGVDYVMSQSTGKIQIISAGTDNFPDLEVDLQSLKLYADYQMKDNMSVHAAYWYESYDTKSWALDGVNPDTVWNVLGFGEMTPSYDVSVITVSLRYKF